MAKASKPLLLDIPVVLRSLSDVIGRYDAVLVDQFGVLHNGVQAIEGSVEVIENLRNLGKPIIILSNTSKRKSYVQKLLQNLGFGEVDDICCSGEMAYHHIDQNYKGKKCCFVTWSEESRLSENWMQGLDIELSTADHADFILFHGTQSIVTSASQPGTPITFFSTGIHDETLLELMNAAVRKDITAICANQDFTAVQNTGNVKKLHCKL